MVLVILIFAALSIFVLFERHAISGEPTGKCATCKYDMAGLADDAICPECGSDWREVSPDLAEVHRRRRNEGLWVGCLAVLVVYLCAAVRVAQEFVVWGFLYDGFSTEIANRVHVTDPDRAVLLMLPLTIAVTSLPVTCLLVPKRRAVFMAVVLLIIGVVLAAPHAMVVSR